MKRFIALLIALMMVCASAVAEEMENVTLIAPMPAQAQFAFDSNPTTGYTWVVSIKNSGVVEATGEDFVADENAEGLVGVGGTAIFTLSAVASGEAVVEFVYGRAWLSEVAESRVYLVTVLEDGTMAVRSLEGEVPLIGTVSNVEEGAVLVHTEDSGDVLCVFPPEMTLPVMDEQVKIWFNGAMTMSLPGQVYVFAWETIAPEIARGE